MNKVREAIGFIVSGKNENATKLIDDIIWDTYKKLSDDTGGDDGNEDETQY